jgi:hypothetical protein
VRASGPGHRLRGGINPSEPPAPTERGAKRQGRKGPGDGRPISGRLEALKAKAQERCRDETDPARSRGRP